MHINSRYILLKLNYHLWGNHSLTFCKYNTSRTCETKISHIKKIYHRMAKLKAASKWVAKGLFISKRYKAIHFYNEVDSLIFQISVLNLSVYETSKTHLFSVLTKYMEKKFKCCSKGTRTKPFECQQYVTVGICRHCQQDILLANTVTKVMWIQCLAAN